MKRLNILILVLLCLLIPIWYQVTRPEEGPEPEFEAVSVVQSSESSEIVPQGEETADILYSIEQVEPSAALDEVKLRVSLVPVSKDTYWELSAYSQVPWEQSTFQLALQTKDERTFPIDVLEKDYKKNFGEASLLLGANDGLTAEVDLAPYLSDLPEQTLTELSEAFAADELECQAQVRTRIAVPQPGEEVRYAKLETSVRCRLEPKKSKSS